jgi:hypothetical protein
MRNLSLLVLRVLMRLAQDPERLVSIREISADEDLSPNSVSKAVAGLLRHAWRQCGAALAEFGSRGHLRKSKSVTLSLMREAHAEWLTGVNRPNFGLPWMTQREPI